MYCPIWSYCLRPNFAISLCCCTWLEFPERKLFAENPGFEGNCFYLRTVPNNDEDAEDDLKSAFPKWIGSPVLPDDEIKSSPIFSKSCQKSMHSRYSFFSFLKMGQSRPLFVYFRSFLIIILTQIEKSIDGVLEIRTRGRRMVGADKTTELWRPP